MATDEISLEQLLEEDERTIRLVASHNWVQGTHDVYRRRWVWGNGSGGHNVDEWLGWVSEDTAHCWQATVCR